LLAGTPEERAAALGLVAPPRVVAMLAPVPAENLPTAGPMGPPAVLSVTELAATTRVTLADGTALDVSLLHAGTGWQVTSMTKAAP
jgi:hypothetical protein